MGTIDENIDILKRYNFGFTGYIGCLQNTIDETIPILQKYKAIKQIIDNWDAGIYDDQGLCHTEVLEMISDIIN